MRAEHQDIQENIIFKHINILYRKYLTNLFIE